MPDKTRIITGAADLKRVIDDLLQAPRVALDIEADGFYNYRESVCIVTLSDEESDFVVDTLALGEESRDLSRLVGREDTPLLMHSGQNDVLALKRTYGFEFGMVQDTSVAAMLLGIEQTGLAAIVEGYLGLTLEKGLQRYDWSRRPIETEHLQYLVNDTRHLFAVHDLMEDELRKHELVEEYRIECRAVAEAEPKSREFDPERFRRIKGHGDLTDRQRGALKALYAWRDDLARELDRAPFRVVSDATLLGLARRDVPAPDALRATRGVGEWLAAEHGESMLNAMRAGLKQPAPVRAPKAHRTGPRNPRMDPQQRDRLGRLKRWRQHEAERRKIGIQAVLPTAALAELVLDPPPDLAALGKVARVGASRASRYGDEILRILKS